MPVERYYLAAPFLCSSEAVLSETEHHHLARVMRTSPGDAVELVNGCGELAVAEVMAIGKNSTTLLLKEVSKQARERSVILIQALPKLPRLELIVEKGTELGMTELWLFPGQRSAKGELNEHQQHRLKSHMIAAMKQSGRLFLPDLKLFPPLFKWNQKFKGFAFYGEFAPETPLLKEIWDGELARESGVSIVIGPESGLTPEEKQQLAELGVRPASINKNILRTETAPLAALALVQHWLM